MNTTHCYTRFDPHALKYPLSFSFKAAWKLLAQFHIALMRNGVLATNEQLRYSYKWLLTSSRNARKYERYKRHRGREKNILKNPTLKRQTVMCPIKNLNLLKKWLCARSHQYYFYWEIIGFKWAFNISDGVNIFTWLTWSFSSYISFALSSLSAIRSFAVRSLIPSLMHIFFSPSFLPQNVIFVSYFVWTSCYFSFLHWSEK